MKRLVLHYKELWMEAPDLAERLLASGVSDDAEFLLTEDGYVYIENDATDPIAKGWDFSAIAAEYPDRVFEI